MEEFDLLLLLEQISDEEEDEDEEFPCTDHNPMEINHSEEHPIYPNGFCLWECTDENCVLQFRRRSDRDNHMDTGKHKYESNKMVLVEKAKFLYKDCLEKDIIQKAISCNNFNVVQNSDGTKIVNQLRQGWALPAKRVHKRFDSNQREYLIEAYEQGEITGFKMNPSTLSVVSATYNRKRNDLFFQEMQYVKENGRFRFSPEEWLTAKQIKSFFSTLTQNRRQSSNSTTRKVQTSSRRNRSKLISDRSNPFEPNIEETESISQDVSENQSDLAKIHQMKENISNSNFQSDSDTDEELETQFDERIVAMDIEDMLTSAKGALIDK